MRYGGSLPTHSHPRRWVVIICGYAHGGSRERNDPPRGSEVALVFPRGLFPVESCGRVCPYTLVSAQFYSYLQSVGLPPANTAPIDGDQGPKGNRRALGDVPAHTSLSLSLLCKGCQGRWEAGSVLLGGFTWSPRTTDLQAAKEILK